MYFNFRVTEKQIVLYWSCTAAIILFLPFPSSFCFRVRLHMLEREMHFWLSHGEGNGFLKRKVSSFNGHRICRSVSETPCVCDGSRCEICLFEISSQFSDIGYGLRIGDGFFLRWVEGSVGGPGVPGPIRVSFFNGSKDLFSGPLLSLAPPPARAIQNTSYYVGSFLSNLQGLLMLPDFNPDLILQHKPFTNHFFLFVSN